MRHSEPTSESHTLPPAELNPLINPILAENMGRWAEVYFTSPPESREQAVLELLRELEAEKSQRDAALASDLAAQPPLVPCPNCGHDNPPNNKFCGMCGASTASEESRTGGHDYSRGLHRHIGDQPRPEQETEHSEIDPPVYHEIPASRHELSLFQAYRETDDDEANEYWNYEPRRSTSYRGYIGLVLAIMFAGLGFMAWRQMQSSQTSHEIAPPPPAATQPGPAENQTSAPTKSEPPNNAGAANSAPAAAAPVEKNSGGNSPAESPTTAPPVASAKPAKTEVSPSARPAPPAAPDTTDAAPSVDATAASDRWGAEELAVAQRYLNGASGQRRDTAEAAKWLWKSIAKHNGEATLLLADLYLKGDGVPKNCDQARVLLDSAGRKGVHGAAERLRNLQAFGCQ